MRTANPNKKQMYKCCRVRRRRDRFSELPDGLLDKILGCMPTLDAARLAVLSTLWRDTWFSITTLDFDMDFFNHIRDKYSRYYCNNDRRTRKLIYDNHNIDTLVSESLYIINKIIMHHSGPVRKFRFLFGCCDFGSLNSRMFDIYQWLMFVTQKGVEEIHLKIDEEDGFMLPNCIFSCPTLRRLRIHGSFYDTVDAPRNILNLTSLSFECVDFEPSGHAINAPMLENLSFYSCDETMFHFNIIAPKLGTLTIEGCSYLTNGYLPINYSSWEFVHTLVLDGYSIMYFFEPFTGRGLPQQPPQLLNVEHLMLLDDPLECDIDAHYALGGDISPTFIHLLQLCPKLCKLHMDVSIIEMLEDCLGTHSELTENLYRVASKSNLLHTMILSDVPYRGEIETWLSGIKGLLACFPTLEKLVIRKQFNLRAIKKILHFPRASPKIEIVFI
ncbi:unnamed protein product [Cuscuta epithymum]|uniref:F-box domain-containing protein n=1 Tax=Cuscuta epithymum TaxID=186058 RepID=A0AAV0GHC2_9ASTE|nr:unnamed protein product [Cuscuta epithymum]CAH9147324.1 unnamed protein product [Cuscuta epithymum]